MLSVYRPLTMLVARINWVSGVTTALRELGPYAAIALLLPGGKDSHTTLRNTEVVP